jgi:D-alanyl-D-alanine carboxypeptidase (penicillin-binding protein 5/6)
MNKNDYNRGKFKTSQQSKSRYTTSKRDVGNRRLIVLQIGFAIFLLAVMIALFACVFPGGLFAWNSLGDGGTKPHIEGTIPKPTDPNKDYPYVTNPDKSNFIASDGGEYLSGLYSKTAILVRLSDMTTIGYKNADEVIYPASMTKLMTVITALDLIENLDDTYVFDPEVLDRIILESKLLENVKEKLHKELKDDGAHANMKYLYEEYFNGSDYEWITYTVRDLIYGISYRSGWDSVVCLIDYLGLTWDHFVALMNSKANEIGLQNTYFGGAIGMDLEENQTTCRDMAAIMAYAMENPLCAEFFGGTSYRLTYMKMTYTNRTLNDTFNNMGTNLSKVLGSKYTIVATKSGYETNAGYCLVSCIQNNESGELFVLVTANAKNGTKYSILDMQEIFDSMNP